MRKESIEITKAFIAGKSLKKARTTTDGQAIYLHGNKIAEKRQDGIYVTLAGWNTSTTRERVNTLIKIINGEGYFSQKKFKPYFNNNPCLENEWYKISNKIT